MQLFAVRVELPESWAAKGLLSARGSEHGFSPAIQLALAGAVCLRTIAALFERSLDTARYACSMRAPRRLFRFDARWPPTASGMTAAARVTGADLSNTKSMLAILH